MEAVYEINNVCKSIQKYDFEGKEWYLEGQQGTREVFGWFFFFKGSVS